MASLSSGGGARLVEVKIGCHTPQEGLRRPRAARGQKPSWEKAGLFEEQQGVGWPGRVLSEEGT